MNPGAQRSCDASNPLCVVNWAAANTCVATAVDDDCQLHVGSFLASQGPVGQSTNGADLPPPSTMVATRQPYKMCNNLYPWFIFKNLGNGRFSDTPAIKYQPLPLESDAGDSAITGAGVSATNQGVLDLDGDGRLDGIVNARDADQNAEPYWWFVWPGDGTGGLGPKRYVWTGRIHASISGSGLTTDTALFGAVGLFDVNGDGLVDHWSAPSPNPLDPDSFTNANVALNDGVSFRAFGASASGELTATVKPGTDGRYYDGDVDGSFLRGATRFAHVRPVDVDNDGRPDMVVTTGTRGETAKVYFNQGGQFATTPVPYAWDPGGEYTYTPGEGLRQKVRGDYPMFDHNLPSNLAMTWQVKGDLTDLDGDGIPEAVHWDPRVTGPTTMTRLGHVVSSGPPRLLTSVNNGRGATTTIAYASMHDPTTVVQGASKFGSDGHPKASPRNQWVVKSLSSVDSLAATAAATTYKYLYPRHGADDEGYYGFRGFEEVQTTAPSGAVTVQRYSYSPDWSGRLAATLVIPAEAPGEVRSIDTTTWQERTLFSGPSTQRTYHPIVTEHLTCKNGQDENTCTPTNAAGYTRTTRTLTKLPATGQELMWQETSSLLQAGTENAEGDRDTQTGYSLLADATTYRLHPSSVVKQHRASGAMTTFARSATIWDATNRFPVTETTWFDSVDANAAVTRFEYDSTTGNLTKRWKPVQNATGGSSLYLTNSYDSRKLFVATETNELGQQVDYVYEYGTGTKLTTRGPNIAACVASGTCYPGAPTKEEHRIRIDGMGRMIERWETFSQDGSSYYSMEVEYNYYVDSPTTPNNSVTHGRGIDIDPMWGATIFVTDKTELDGHGRPIRNTVYISGQPVNHITTYHYNNDGTLHDVTTPDPSVDSSATVAYIYGFDSLGRPTSIRRPDTTILANQSGVDITYDGLTSTTTEHVGAAGGNQAVTRTTKDAFGRLVTVDEQTATTPAWATTTYSYGPDDNVQTIVGPAPELVTTTLSHDFAGRRTQITRHGRTWSYGYDRNGNLTSETAPCSPMPVCAASYTTTTVYDDLDRPASKAPAPRDLSTGDIALFGLHHETFVWDYGTPSQAGNYRGRLVYWRSYADATTIAQQVFHTFNAQGQVLTDEQQTTVAGYTLTRKYLQDYLLGGALGFVDYQDFVGGTSGHTTSNTFYDYRGLPSYMMVSRINSGGDRALAVQTRNVAGLVTKRRNDIGTAYVESNWTYDKLGRVTSQVVQKSPRPTEVVRQDLTYLGNDDPSTLTHTLGTSAKQFQFGYDLRHQLTSANATTAGYFASSYQYGSSGRLSRVTIPKQADSLPAGSELKLRAVDYQYAAADPEQVTSLTNVANGQPYATYTYDLPGNQSSRCYGAVTSPTCTGEKTLYVYDGKNQLRRATKQINGVPQGSEEYWYDGEGRRMLVLRRDSASNKTELVWFIGEVEAHYDAAGTVTRVYSHLSLGTPVARVDRTSPTSAPLEYQFHGLASNAIAAVSETGVVNASFSYSPFGEVIEATNAGGASSGTAAHRRRFNDKYDDSLSGLTYYGARYYDKTSLTWTQSDPLYRFEPDAAWNFPRDANLYSINRNNPVRYIDPDGRAPLPLVASKVAGDAATKVAVSLTNAATHQAERERISRTDQPLVQISIGGGPLADAIYDTMEGRQHPADPDRSALGITGPGGPPAPKTSTGGGREPPASTAPSFDKARETAFEKAGMTDPSNVTFSKVDPKTGTVVEFKGPGGAKVGYDGPHPNSPGHLHDQQHISVQSGGKRGAGGAVRENIPYSGPQHPSRSDEKVPEVKVPDKKE